MLPACGECVTRRLAPGVVVQVRAPATSANLGPGFDCLALSLCLFNDISALVLPDGSRSSVSITGEGADSLGGTDANLVLIAMERFAASNDCRLPPLRLSMYNRIPLGRGLGSSAAAISGGLLAAAALLGLQHAPDALLSVGLDMEGHPDNIVAALWGGLTLGVMDGGNAIVQRVSPPAGLRAVLLIPDHASSTLESRAALPAAASRSDAVFNAGRVGLMIYAMLQNRSDLLRVAMADRLHQPYRGEGFRYLMPSIDAALEAGAHGASLSGAGSSVIALASDRFEQIESAFARVAAQYGIPARTCSLELDTEGARLTIRAEQV